MAKTTTRRANPRITISEVMAVMEYGCTLKFRGHARCNWEAFSSAFQCHVFHIGCGAPQILCKLLPAALRASRRAEGKKQRAGRCNRVCAATTDAVDKITSYSTPLNTPLNTRVISFARARKVVVT
jgi:hypothetical protein